jgi:ribosome-associated protein
MDFIDVVVHIFTPEAREFYRLDRLWRQAPQTVFDPDGTGTVESSE